MRVIYGEVPVPVDTPVTPRAADKLPAVAFSGSEPLFFIVLGLTDSAIDGAVGLAVAC